ncbi:MAG: N-acetylmuramoyl-L-alanine amidase [Firmicutes bacterium]|nr:N-acetylmuramoyl-L-alanine amidase [Bacillota bacterium]
MRQSLKIYTAGLLSFSLGFMACLAFMTVPLVPAAASPEDTPVIVIDAGHGGFDGGAEAADGTKEKDINLAIARKLAEEASDYEVEIVMTRDGDYGLYEESSATKKQDDLTARKKIMVESGAGLAVSIHLNSFPQDSSVYGAQVFYAPDEQQRTDVFTAEDMAESVQKSLEINISDGRERTSMKKNDVLLMKDPPCPFIMVDCGFFSCAVEAEKVKSAEYLSVLAAAVWQGINEKLCLPMKNHVPVIDSTNKEENMA